MSTTDHTKAAGKSGQRGRKAPPRGSKADAQPSPKPEQPKVAKAQAAPVVAPARKASNGTAAPAQVSPVAAAAPAPARAVTPASSAPISTAKPADAAAVNLQTIATAYGDYTKKSLEEVRTFVEKLTGARSLNKAIEIQSEFAKQAFQTFVSDSQKICGLYGELAKQTFKPFEGLVAKATQAAR